MHEASDPVSVAETRTNVFRVIGNFCFVAFAVIVPLTALLFELLTHGCFEVYFDPIPTPLHVLLVAFVPLANMFSRWVIATGRREQYAVASWASATSVGIAAFYTLLFIPLLPVSTFGFLYYGLGVLPFAPLFGLVGAALCLIRLRRQGGGRSRPAWIGVALGCAIILLLEVPGAIVQIGFEQENVSLLRALGSRNGMLRATHHGIADANLSGHLIYGESWLRMRQLRRADFERYRGIFYRVTGDRVEAHESPRLMGFPTATFLGGRFWDRDRGGSRVGASVRALSVPVSRMDGRFDAESAYAYIEWTLVFRNHSPQQQEARAQIALPSGGVVSRATLWVHGEEREAAFGTRGKVRAAYERVVQARRDPLLVTEAGRDHVLVQCFPVPPEGGEMRIRLGITIPIELDSITTGRLWLPWIVEHNTDPDIVVEHAAWIDSNTPFESVPDGLVLEDERDGLYTARGSLSNDVPHWLTASRSEAVREVWASDPIAPNGALIRQRITQARAMRDGRLVVVVDGSQGMQQYANAIADALATLPDDLSFDLILASDEVVVLSDRSVPVQTRDEGIDALRRARFVGGQDSVPALIEAWERAPTSGSILWIHGQQPSLFEPIDGLLQRYERRAGGPNLISFQLSRGADRVLEVLPPWIPHERIAVPETWEADLRRRLAGWTDQAEQLTIVRERASIEDRTPVPNPNSTASVHLTRLWAKDEITNILLRHHRGAEEEAAALAIDYRLVTAVSGAVVLETDRQYAAADLEAPDELRPFDPGLQPIPEPGTGLLVTLGLLILGYRGHSKHRRRSC